MIQNAHTYLSKSVAFAANLFKQVRPFSTHWALKVQCNLHEIERELVKGFIKNSLLRFSV